MTKRSVIKISVLLLILLVAAVPASIGHAASVGKIDQQIQEEESNKAEIESGIAGLKGSITDLQSYLSELDSQMAELNGNLADNQNQIADKEAEIAATDEMLRETREIEQQQYEAMKKRIRFMYERQADSLLGILANAGNLADVLNKTSYISEMVAYDRNMLEKYNQTRIGIEQAQSQLASQKEELLALQKELDGKRNEINALLDNSTVQIAKYEDQVSEAEAAALGKEESIRQLQIQRMDAIAAASASSEKTIENIQYTYVPQEDDLKLLATIIYCEAANQPYEGKLAVGSVIINRVNSARFSQNTIYDVIFAPGQFAPVASGRFALRYAAGVTEECTRAAQEVLNGNVTGEWLFFLLNDGTRVGDVIGDHVFFYYW
ncbi:cell wall hydrolase [Parasporobacterium paucivorans]|uniref:N-terminal domain of peptidoglycan hydrolase CwlO-containing protein n=1 Tax=Parasporobacterium paucivorans DSM 15970 TaxID=1122934 RepID=A0A1M6C8L3_9FIRM|nr:cell wall hydrolase [Parasporobacterium paucivorans]SHI57345.1 N-terminal domain of peptidoglycan hydrolase CwlO-containing protein [Parasporobacterium paucivorans DSM 15970]